MQGPSFPNKFEFVNPNVLYSGAYLFSYENDQFCVTVSEGTIQEWKNSGCVVIGMVTVKPNWKEFMDANHVNFTSFSSRSDLERFLYKYKNIFHKATKRKADVKSLLCISMVISKKTLLKCYVVDKCSLPSPNTFYLSFQQTNLHNFRNVIRKRP